MKNFAKVASFSAVLLTSIASQLPASAQVAIPHHQVPLPHHPPMAFPLPMPLPMPLPPGVAPIPQPVPLPIPLPGPVCLSCPQPFAPGSGFSTPLPSQVMPLGESLQLEKLEVMPLGSAH